jgi:bacterioferritin
MIENDYRDELNAVHSYNEGIKLAREAHDEASADLLIKILNMEEGHVDWGEAQKDQIEQIGIENYLMNQIS